MLIRESRINASFSTLQCALESFWNEVNERGNLENIAFPIIGSGKGGLKASREDIVKEIVFSFIVVFIKIVPDGNQENL